MGMWCQLGMSTTFPGRPHALVQLTNMIRLHVFVCAFCFVFAMVWWF